MSTEWLKRLSVMAMAAGVVLVIALIIWAVAYALSAPREGNVVQAWLVPAHSERYQSGSICMIHKKSGSCTFSMPLYSTRWVDDKCYVKIHDGETTQRDNTLSVDCPSLGYYTPGKFVSFK